MTTGQSLSGVRVGGIPVFRVTADPLVARGCILCVCVGPAPGVSIERTIGASIRDAAGTLVLILMHRQAQPRSRTPISIHLGGHIVVWNGVWLSCARFL